MKLHNEETLKALYEFIKGYQKDFGRSPSYRTILNRFPTRFQSCSTVKGYLDVLERRELIRKDKSGAIAVEERFVHGVTNAPLVGRVACGSPTEAIESIEGVYALPPEIFGGGELMLLRAEGQSMENAGINTGDLIVIRRQNDAEYGQIILALIEDQATVKRYYPKKNGEIILHPENDKMKDIVVENCNIQGIVVGCIKTY